MFLSENNLLVYSGLYVFVKIGIRNPEDEPVGPVFPGHSEFCHYDFVVEGVMETPHMFYVVFVHGELMYVPVFVRFEFPYPVVDIVAVVGIILEGVDFVCKTVFEGLAEIHV